MEDLQWQNKNNTLFYKNFFIVKWSSFLGKILDNFEKSSGWNLRSDQGQPDTKFVQLESKINTALWKKKKQNLLDFAVNDIKIHSRTIGLVTLHKNLLFLTNPLILIKYLFSKYKKRKENGLLIQKKWGWKMLNF